MNLCRGTLVAAFSAADFKEWLLSEIAKVSRLSVIEIDILFRQLHRHTAHRVAHV